MSRYLPAGSFRRNVAVVALGTAVAQGLVVLASPVLTRLYDPEDFGVLAVFIAIVTMLSLVGSWSFQFAIPLPEDDGDGANVMAVSVVVLGFMTALAALVAGAAGGEIADLVNTPGIEAVLWLVPVAMFSGGLFHSFNYWAIRVGAFTPLAVAKGVQGAATVAPQLAGGAAGGGSGLLVAGDVIGRAAATLLLGVRTVRRSMLRAVNLRAMRRVFVRYRRFPLFSSWGQLLNTLGAQLPPVVFAGLYGAEPVGWFALSFRVLAAPTSLIGGSVAQVYVGEAARLARDDLPALDRLFTVTARRLLLVGMVPYGVVGAFGPPLFSVVFGGDWRQAGLYAQVMAVMLLLTLVVNPLSLTLTVLERQDWQAAWDAARLVVVVGGMVAAGALSRSPTVGVVVYSATSVATLVALWAIMRTALRRASRDRGAALLPGEPAK